MKKLIVLMMAACAFDAAQARTLNFPFAGSVVVLLDSAQSAALNSRPDAYTAEHTLFDLSIRFNRAANLTEKDYLSAAARDARDWPEDEQQQLKEAFDAIAVSIKKNGLRMKIPDTVMMAKTTAAEEFGAEGWTRGNRIMLNTKAEPISVHLIAHELWHVISRADKAGRDAAYSVFHFRPCNNIVYKPALHDQVITNPDCPFLMHCITLKMKDGRSQDAALILYSKKKFEPGHDMSYYLSFGLLELTGDDQHKKPLLKNGAPVIHELPEVPDLFAQVGMNTQYLLHIEEVTAEHFAALIGSEKMKQMEYVDGLRRALQ